MGKRKAKEGKKGVGCTRSAKTVAAAHTGEDARDANE